jgi:hypothetical protein
VQQRALLDARDVSQQAHAQRARPRERFERAAIGALTRDQPLEVTTMRERAHGLWQAFDRHQPRERKQREAIDAEPRAQRGAVLVGARYGHDAHRLHAAASERKAAKREREPLQEARARALTHEPERATAAHEASR